MEFYIHLYKLLFPHRYRRYLELADGDTDKCHETLLHGTYYEEYDSYDFAHKSSLERREYLTDAYRNKLCRRINNARQQAVIMNKYCTATLFRDFYHREFLLCEDECQRDFFVAMGMRHGRLVVKPVDDCAGRGVRLMTASESSQWSIYYSHLIEEGRHFIVEQLIVQLPEMARWNESSVNTVRVNTMNCRGDIRLLTANMRCGCAGNFVDNCAQGGFCANIDPVSGRIITSATSKGVKRYVCHPDSGVPFEGEAIVQWSQLLQTVDTMAQRLPQLTYVSWDLALTEEGWTLVEANKGELIADQRNLCRGLRRDFERLAFR